VAYRVLPFQVTIPPGTPVAAPFSQAIDLNNWEIESVDLEVPSGPNGLMGFQVTNNGVAWIPYGDQEWIVWNDHSENYPLQDQPTGQGWGVVGYNLGTNPHTVTLRFHVNPTDPTADQAPVVPQVTFVTTPTAAAGVVL
jgi:hypothetical protein